MTTVSNRPAPDGYTEEWDHDGWNVGFVFQWSDVYDGWLDCEVVVTVKPGQTLSEAFEDRMGHPMWGGILDRIDTREFSVFFSNEA